MKNTFLQITIILSLNLLVACTTVENNSDINDTFPEKDLLANTDWLIGTWKNSTPERMFSETWIRLDDTTMQAKTVFTEGKDTISKESINLVQRKNEIFYVVEVNNQNGGKPVNFKLVSSSQDSLVFENPKHDFPQKIRYYKISNDSLVAEISGLINGKYASEKFPMGRLK